MLRWFEIKMSKSKDTAPKTRSQIMSMIKGKNTKPEIIVRKYLFSRKIRYRINDKRLSGTPDIVLPKFKTVIFINGCFWHGHSDCKISHIPKTNVEYWTNKIERNKKRDIRNKFILTNLGWNVITIWECQLKKDIRELILQKLETKLYTLFLDQWRKIEN